MLVSPPGPGWAASAFGKRLTGRPWIPQKPGGLFSEFMGKCPIFFFFFLNFLVSDCDDVSPEV